MVKETYTTEIIQILREQNDGCITGFNELVKKRHGNKKFNTNRLVTALKKLEKNNEITVKKTGNNQNKYCLVDHQYMKGWQTLYEKELQPLANKIDITTNQKERYFLTYNYLKHAYYLYQIFNLYSLYPYEFELIHKLPIIQKIASQIINDIKNKIEKMTEQERKSLISTIFPKKPELLSLTEFRNLTHIPTPKEKKQMKKEHLANLEKEFQNHPFCMWCGHKSKNYAESKKHEETHAKNLEKDPFKSISQFQAIYCETCGDKFTNFNSFLRHTKNH
jgi:hypothetical protein